MLICEHFFLRPNKEIRKKINFKKLDIFFEFACTKIKVKKEDLKIRPRLEKRATTLKISYFFQVRSRRNRDGQDSS